jgi:hypothetical protein
VREYVDRLGNQVHPMIQTLFPNNDKLFQDNSPPFTQLELFSHGLKSMKVNFQHLPWPAQPPDLNIIEPLWSVLEIRVRNGFPPPKPLGSVLKEEWYKILLETVQNLHEFIPRRIAAVLKEKGGPAPY